MRRSDEVDLNALGAQRILDPTTAGDFCRRFGRGDVLDLMDAINQTHLRLQLFGAPRSSDQDRPPAASRAAQSTDRPAARVRGQSREQLGYMVMASLAWSLNAWAALLVPATPWHVPKHRAEKQTLWRMEFRAFCAALIEMPCQIVRGSPRLVYRLLSWHPWQGVFLRLVERLHGAWLY